MSRRFLFSFFLACPFWAIGQKAGSFKEPRILLLVDGSSSMLQSWQGNETRFQTAARLIDGLMDSMYRINPGVEFALRVYGHQSPVTDSNCYDTKREVMFSKNNRDQMALRLASLGPYGVSPIAYSLQRAAEEDLTDEHRYSYSVILLTDGGESCGGDLCAVSKTLSQRAVFFRPYIISMVDYAPLAVQYSCLGSYLTVARQEQMRPAIQTILDAYRPALRKLSETPVEVPQPAPLPPATTVRPPVAAPQPQPALPASSLAYLAPRRVALPFPVAFTPLPAAGRRPVPALSLPARQPEPVAPPPPVVRTTVAALPVRLGFRIPPAGTFTLLATPRPRPIPVLNRPAPEADPEMEPLTFVLRRNRIVEMTSPVFAVRPRPIPTLSLPRPIADAPPVVAIPPTPKPTPLPAQPATPPRPAKVDAPVIADYNTRTEAAAESGLQVYFTDGKGKFYQSTPQVALQTKGTGKVVQKFYRTVGPSGEPDFQKVPPGSYDVVVTGRSNVMARNITIGPNQKTNLLIVVTNGSLRFSYTQNPKRPVAEFEASVVRRFADDRSIVRQKGTEEKPYEPGNYYLELNTLPVTRRNLDIEFGSTTEIQIAEPGWVQFTNTAPLTGKVVLYQPLGDGFASFLQLEITGDLEMQKIRLQPGTYEARRAGAVVGAAPVVVRFQVNSNQTTQTEL